MKISNLDSQSNDGYKKRKYTTQLTQVERAIAAQNETNEILKTCVTQNSKIIELIQDQILSQNKTNELLQTIIGQGLNNDQYGYLYAI